MNKDKLTVLVNQSFCFAKVDALWLQRSQQKSFVDSVKNTATRITTWLKIIRMRLAKLFCHLISICETLNLLSNGENHLYNPRINWTTMFGPLEAASPKGAKLFFIKIDHNWKRSINTDLFEINSAVDLSDGVLSMWHKHTHLARKEAFYFWT